MHEIFNIFILCFVFQSMIIINIFFNISYFPVLYSMILEIVFFSPKIRRVTAAFVTVLNNAYAWCPFGLVRFPSHINKNIKILHIKNRHLRPLPRRPPHLPPPMTVPLAKQEPTKRWTSQFKIMDCPLALKKPISEYFRQHPQNARKLTSIARMDRHQRGLQPPGRHLRGHDTDAKGQGHPRQPGDVHHDRGYRDAKRGIPANPSAERHHLTTLTGRYPHGIDPGSGAYLVKGGLQVIDIYRSDNIALQTYSPVALMVFVIHTILHL